MTDAENERLRTQWDQLVRIVDRITQQRDDARAEVEELRAKLHTERNASMRELDRQRSELVTAAGVAERLRAELDQARRGGQELARAVQLAVVTIRAAWVEAERIGADEGIEVLEDVVLATAPDLPDLGQYDGAQDVFDAEYTVADRSDDARRLRARLAAKEA